MHDKFKSSKFHACMGPSFDHETFSNKKIKNKIKKDPKIFVSKTSAQNNKN